MLSEEQRKELRQIFLEEIEKLERSVADLQDRSRPVAPDNAIGRISRMDSIVQQSTAEHLQHGARERLEQLRDRLSEIDSPSFGICARCGQSIPLERLKAVPNAAICVACAQYLRARR